MECIFSHIPPNVPPVGGFSKNLTRGCKKPPMRFMNPRPGGSRNIPDIPVKFCGLIGAWSNQPPPPATHRHYHDNFWFIGWFFTTVVIPYKISTMALYYGNMIYFLLATKCSCEKWYIYIYIYIYLYYKHHFPDQSSGHLEQWVSVLNPPAEKPRLFATTIPVYCSPSRWKVSTFIGANFWSANSRPVMRRFSSSIVRRNGTILQLGS